MENAFDYLWSPDGAKTSSNSKKRWKYFKKNSCPYRESNPGPLGLEPNTLSPTPSEPLFFLFAEIRTQERKIKNFFKSKQFKFLFFFFLTGIQTHDHLL